MVSVKKKHFLKVGGEKRGLVTNTKPVNLIQVFFCDVIPPPF